MADNVGYTPGTGATVAADEISGVLHQRVKITLGADGVSDGDVSSSNPIPITAPSGITISGTANVNVANSSVPVAPATAAVFDINAVGEMIECLEAIRQYQISLNRTIGMLMPDTSGRLRVLIDAISANLTLGTITTVSTVTNTTQFGSQPAQEVIYGALHMGADSSRRNITVS